MDKYKINTEKFDNIIAERNGFYNISLYRTHIKIATNEYVAYLNSIPMNIDINSQGSESFAKKIGSKFVVNTKLVNKSIAIAEKRGEFNTFHFFFANCVLDKLVESLNNRK